MGRGVIVAAFFMVAAPHVAAQAKERAPLEVTGFLADAKGPLANKVVRVGPVDAKGQMLMIRSLSGDKAGQGLNPQATTDAQGGFKVTVSRNLFRGYSADELGIAAYTDLGGGRMSSSHQPAVVKVDPAKESVDTGRIVLAPLRPR